MDSSPCLIELGRDDVRLRLRGELDLATDPDIAAAANALLEGAAPTRIVLDLRAVTFMDCRGLRSILALVERARRAGVSVTVVPGPPSVQRVFELTGTAAALTSEPPAQRRAQLRTRLGARVMRAA